MEDNDYYEDDYYDPGGEEFIEEPEYRPDPEPPPQPKQHQGPQTVEELISLVKEDVRAEVRSMGEEEKIQRRLIADYPGIENPNNILHKWTAHYLTTNFNGNFRYAEDAAFRAARKLGITPKSMQSKTKQPAKSTQQPKSKLTEANLRLAEVWGQDTKDLERYA